MDYLKQAERFLNSQDIDFIYPGIIGRSDDGKIEVIFLVPETIDPQVAVTDPPDIRVWVNKMTGDVELIQQM